MSTRKQQNTLQLTTIKKFAVLFVWVVSQPLFQYSRKEGEMYGCTRVPCVQKLSKLKMKTRQYDTDEAGDYGDAVPVLLEILHNSGFGYKIKMAAGVFTEKCRNTESKNTTNKWVHAWILFYFNRGCLRTKEANRQKLVLNT